MKRKFLFVFLEILALMNFSHVARTGEIEKSKVLKPSSNPMGEKSKLNQNHLFLSLPETLLKFIGSFLTQTELREFATVDRICLNLSLSDFQMIV